MNREHRGAVRHGKSLRPVPQIEYSAGCDGTGETLAMEIVTTAHMRAPETSRVDVEDRVDVACPRWIAENSFIGQVLPHARLNALVDTSRDSSAVEVPPLVVAREIEAYMQDMHDAWWFSESLHQDILHTYSSVTNEFGCFKVETSTKLQVMYVTEPEPCDIPLARDGGCKNGNSVVLTLLDDADSILEDAKSVHQNSVEAFELKLLDEDLLPEQHSARSRDTELEENSNTEGQASSTSASDWLDRDWHLSQASAYNNLSQASQFQSSALKMEDGCFNLQSTEMENELCLTVQRDMVPGKQMPDDVLLLSLDEDSLPWQYSEAEYSNKEVYPADYHHASAPALVYDSSNFVCTAAEVAGEILSDQSALTHDPRNNFPSAGDQVPLAGSGPSTMNDILSLLRQARQGDFPRGAESMEVPESEFYQEQVHQGVANSESKSHDQSPEEYQVFESASNPVKIPTPNPLSSEIDAAFSCSQQSLNLVKPDLQVLLCTPGCPSKELPQIGIKSAPPLQPADKKLSLQQAEMGDSIELCSGEGQELHLIIVVNILQSSESIILQRRSSYQKILGLENEDLQVVERELKLPVDLLLNPSTCLTVYTEDKLLRCAQSHNPNSKEFFSCIMGMVVDCHMKALSFSFERWFMIFEGELAFNSAIIHILNKLYVCSAGFQMRVQGFISANPEDTDSLVLGCIKKMWKMSKRPFFSPMSEVLTHGEVFLTSFPFINPLSSHAILGLNVSIATFISWSHEERNCALQDVSVRAESLNLLTAQVLYGKLEASLYRGIFSECPWPAASEIVAPEVGRHVPATFTYFQPTSEITGGEFEQDSGVSPREGHSDPCTPICPYPIVPYDSAEQGTSTWDGVWWPDDDQSAKFAQHAYDFTQQPDCLRENYGCKNPVGVRGILQQWIGRRKGGEKFINHSETESEHHCDSFEVPYNEPHHERPCMDRLPTAVGCPTNAVYPTYRHEANVKLGWASSLKISGKRPAPVLEQFLHQKGVSRRLHSHKKKLKQAVQSNRLK